MTETDTKPEELPINLGNGLVLRRSTVQDAEALADFNARIQSDEGPDKPDDRVGAWAYDLLTKPHPTFKPGDFTVVEELSTGKIVSSMNLIPQTWTYAGIPFKVGRPELVGTLIDYRNRGLVRRQFDVIHRWSAQNGDKLQVITGIPYYYRVFGYEMALNLSGGRMGYPTHIPRLNEGEQELFRFRPATEADISFLSEHYIKGCQRSLVACLRNETVWMDELYGKSAKNVQRLEHRIIETVSGDKVGFISHPFFPWGEMMPLFWYELTSGFTWREVTPSVIRYLEDFYTQYKPETGTKKPLGAFGLWFGDDHPVYHIMPDRIPYTRKPYAFYLRLPDVLDFLQLITPVLEKRLSVSALAGYSGEVRITFYRDGVRLVFDKGKLGTVEAYKPTPSGHSGNAGFPPYTFLQLLFGYRSIEMLKASFADCWTDRDEIHILLDALFPQVAFGCVADFMTSLGVLADTHVPDRAAALDPQIIQVFRKVGVAAILHAGDVSAPPVLAELEQVAPVYAVRGNRDIFYLRNLPIQVKLNIEGVSIGMAHGHGNFSRYMIDKIQHSIRGVYYEQYLQRMHQTFPDMDVIVFGHVHVPYNFHLDGKLLFNPGSTSFPALQGSPATFGLLHLEPRKAPRGEIIELGG